jgi:hypothetical protein
VALLRRHRQFRVNTLVAERVLLAAPAGSAAGAGSAAPPSRWRFGRRLTVAGELGLRGGRPELRLLAGRVVLMDEARDARVQLDAAFAPAPRVTQPTPETRRTREAALDRLRPWAGRPALVFSEKDEVAAAVVDAEQGWVNLAARARARAQRQGDDAVASPPASASASSSPPERA